MLASHELPDHDELVAELGTLREQGLQATRRLPLPTLRSAVGLITGRPEGDILQSDVEAVLRDAVDRFGGGDMQDAAARTFGLAAA